MSIATQIARLQENRNTIRDQLITWGVAEATDTLDILAETISGIPKRTLSQTLTASNPSVTLSAGYYQTGTVSVSTQVKTAEPADTAQTVTPDTGKFLSQVTIAAIDYSAAPVITLGYGNLTASTAKGRYLAGTDNVSISATGLTGKAAHVLSGYKVIGLNSDGTAAASVEGSIANNGAGSSYVLDTTTTSKTFAAGYWSSANTVSISTQVKTATPATDAQVITPDTGKVLSQVSIAAIPNQQSKISKVLDTTHNSSGTYTNTSVTIPAGYYTAAGSVEISVEEPVLTPTTATSAGTDTYYPDDGKVFGKVTVNKVLTQTKTATLKVASGTTVSDVISPDSGYLLSGVTVPRVQTEVQATTASTSAITVTPSTGKYLSQVTVAPTPTETKTVSPVWVSGTTTSDTYTPSEGKYFSSFTVNRIDSKYQDISGVTATAADVLASKKFVTSAGVLTTGTMTNQGAVSKVLDTSTTSYTIPAGYHNGSGTVSISTEVKAVSSSITAQEITPSTGKVLSKVTIAAMPVDTLDNSIISGQAVLESGANETADYAWESTVTIPAGYHSAATLTKTFSNILPVPDTAAADAQILSGYQAYTSAGKLLTGSMANNGAGSSYTLDTTTTSKTLAAGYWSSANTVSISTQVKAVDPATTAQTITPDSGKVLSQVTVAAMPAGALSSGAGSVSASGKNNLSLGTAVSTAPSSGYYLQTSGSGTVSVGTAGYLAKDTSKASNTATLYYPITGSALSSLTSLPSGASVTSSVGYGKYIKISAGYNHSDRYISSGVSAGSATTPETTIEQNPTISWDTSAETFKAAYTKTQSVTPNVSAGYVSAGTAGNVTSTGSTDLGVVTVTASLAGNVAKVTPVIAKASVPSGVTDASNGSITTTAPTTGIYVAVSAAAKARTVTATPSVSVAGYGNTSHYNVPATLPTIDAGSAASGTYYVPIKTGSAATPETTIEQNPTISWDSTNKVVKATYTKTQAITPSITAGYVSSGTAGNVTATGTTTAGIATLDSNMIAANIKDGVTIFGIEGTYSEQAAATAAGASHILKDKVAYVNGSAVTGTMANNGKVTKVLDATTKTNNVLSNTSYTIPAGYHNGEGTVSISTQVKAADPATTAQTITPDDGKVLSQVTIAAMPAGALSAADSSISGGSFTPTLTYNSTNDNFTYSGSADATGTAYAKVSTVGYVTSSDDTSKALSATVSATGSVAKVILGASASGTAKVTPAISKESVPSGVTDPTTSDAATTTAPSSGVYVAVKSAASANTLTLSPSVSTAGYGTTSYYGTVAAADRQVSVGANASDTTYIKIKESTSSKTQPTASATAGTASIVNQPSASASTSVTGMITTSTNTGYAVSASASANSGNSTATGGSASTTAGSLSVSTGYVGTAVSTSVAAKSASGDTATSTAVSESASDTKYIQKGVLSASISSNSSGSASMAATGFTASSSATSYYVTLSTSAGSVKAKASVGTEGYVKSETAETSATSVSVSGNNNKLYIPSGSITNNTTLPSGSSSSGTLNYGKVIKIGAGYHSSDVYYAGQTDSDLTAANIKTGVEILGTTGTYTSDATASASDILSGKTAYVNGSKITGSLANVASTTVSNNFTVYQNFTAGSAVTASTSIAGSDVPAGGSIRAIGGIAATGGIKGSQVYNAVWNDLADAIPVNDECDLEYGYCYCFDGERYYKSSKYLDDGIIGIHSDTAGFVMGTKGIGKEMQVAVAGFVLAYVDKEYKPGTLLTCAENGYLTAVNPEDKLSSSEKIIASFWKPEPNETWGSDERQIKVNGRMWVKIR